MGTIQDQIISMKTTISRAETEVKQSKLLLEEISKELPRTLKAMEETKSKMEQFNKVIKVKQNELDRINNDMKKLNYEEGSYECLESEKTELTKNREQAATELAKLYRRDQAMEFIYTDPTPDFDRSRVKGRLGRLFTVIDPKFSLAIETALAGQVYCVVVDNENTSQLLIEKGNLARRTTFIPLNKIRSNPMNGNVIKAAQRLAGDGNVFPALGLISYAPEYQKAMEYILGNVFICTNNEAARKVTFCPEIRKKSITLEGDVYDNSGVLSGGVEVATAGILQRVQHIMAVEKQIDDLSEAIHKIDKKLKSLTSVYERFILLKDKQDTVTHELDTQKQMSERLEYFSHKTDYDEMIKKQDEHEKLIIDRNQIVIQNSEKVKQKESDLKNLESIRKKAIDSAKKEFEDIKLLADKEANSFKEKQQDYEIRKVEINNLKEAIIAGEQSVEKSKEELRVLKDQVKELKEKTNEVEEKVKKLESDVKERKNSLKEKKCEVERIKNTKIQFLKDIKKMKESVNQIENALDKIVNETEMKKEKIADLERSNPWIPVEKHNFNTPGSFFDFSNYTPADVVVRLDRLIATRDKLGRTVDKDAQNSLKNEEKKLQESLNKRAELDKDRKLLMDVINDMDDKKRTALTKAWEKVNTDFNSIFGLLLPDSRAKLCILPGKDILAGLEVKVAFGGVWKEGLGELSGGQRSLIALSLVLALLLFKPAPIYILDEIDAALDLSHTQNIGQMLKKHFNKSQFIIVSLKEGMFSNANIIFRTKFVNGTSHVTRTVPKNNTTNQKE